MSFSTLIPVAGRSRRMGYPKAWLELTGETFLARIVRSACEAGTMAVIVICGAEADDDADLVSRIEVTTRITTPPQVCLSVAIGNPEGELIDSLRRGLELLKEGSDLLLWPVDAPLATAELVGALRDALAAKDKQIAVPVVAGKRGHPVLFAASIIDELTSTIADAGAHSVVERDPGRVVEIIAADERLVMAINTPEQARALGISVPSL